MEYSEQLARYVGAFFDELIRGGVKDVVVSPGSRSTPLSMMAHASTLNVYVDVDERGAAFFALGLAKATGRAVPVICTSGTAVANYYPAVLEADTSRVPLMILSGDRPARLQQLGAPQTCDQLKIFGNHVRRFWNMPEVDGSAEQVKFARQIAREALAASEPHTLTSAPIHINFPFDEPLKPSYDAAGIFEAERAELHDDLPVLFETDERLIPEAVHALQKALEGKRVIALCGEGTLGPFNAEDPASWSARVNRAKLLIDWAHAYDIPLLADPLSGLRSFPDQAIIDNYDNIFARDDRPAFDAVIRFGRYPVSKRVFKALEETHLQIVVDPLDTRDFNSTTTTFVKATPLAFVKSLLANAPEKSAPECTNLEIWGASNTAERDLILSVENSSVTYVCTENGCRNVENPHEGAYVQALLENIPNASLLFAANSMAIRALDTFCVKPQPQDDVVHLCSAIQNTVPEDLILLANRGLNGIDGTISTALGAAQAFDQAFLLTGDLTLLHDLNALSLQHEFEIQADQGKRMPKVIIVLFNNGGGGIFDLLPQKSEEPYFERLFLTPQKVDFEHAAQAFGVAYHKAQGLDDFRDTLSAWIGEEGIHLVEVEFKINGLAERYRNFQ